jgi:glycosyltransferase involved in cell wall biosynthesis
MSNLSRKILALDPFLEGSHLDLLQGWKKHSIHDINILGLHSGPWHWRMRHGAISLARKVHELLNRGESWDAIFATSMLHLGEFKSLCPSLAKLPTVVYFHENQLTYPKENKPDPHLIFNQFIGTICADTIWYNSTFHQQEHHQSLRNWLKRMPPPSLLPEFETWKQKGKVVYPGVEIPSINSTTPPSDGPLHLLWSARWEKDKNPQLFVELIRSLKISGLDFKLTLMGHQPPKSDSLIDELKSLLGPLLHQPGFQESRTSMLSLQKPTHLHISTTHHEFFGLSIMESAIQHKAICLPRRLSYPELYGELEHVDDGIIFFENIQEAVSKIIIFDQQRKAGKLCFSKRSQILSKYSWDISARHFDQLTFDN